MEIIKSHNKISRKVESWRQIRKEAKELMKLVGRDDFYGLWKSALAISHCQVSEEPFRFFVVNPDLLRRNMFKESVIINPRILSVRKSSLVHIDEACMSFPHRKTKKVDRYMEVTVEYLYPWMDLCLRKRTETITDLKAQMFQHEIQHHEGKNIYFNE